MYKTRLEVIKDKVNQYPYKKQAARLSEYEFDIMIEFLEDNDQLGHLEFERAVNRMFLDQPNKPKNWAIIQELLVVANSAIHVRNRNF